tara:strand:- start:342 stop:620 length:279 start_codon:yes stop_codon:yes gene_type:complete
MRNPEAFFDYAATRKFIESAATHYSKTAPALCDWLDDVYIALNEAPLTVTVFELFQLQALRLDGEWEHPNYAQNRWYKVREIKGQERGVLSF